MNRRLFFRALAAAGVFANIWTTARAEGRVLVRTPRDYEGPYYPVGSRNKTNDLVVGDVHNTVLNFSGQVVNARGEPLVNTLFDFWQADPLGHYNHPNDRSAGERWDDFLYWGETLTDAQGKFEFRTYVPGDYGSRPPHIHFKLWSEDKVLLTSQVYFAKLGGARGASLSRDADQRQTVNLHDGSDNSVKASLRIVV
jgi:protocatechuate 3,4-dioxygenase beta subunit